MAFIVYVPPENHSEFRVYNTVCLLHRSRFKVLAEELEISISWRFPLGLSTCRQISLYSVLQVVQTCHFEALTFRN